MSVELRLEPAEAKLVFLALAYHLARPGSELDRETKLPVQRGLAEVSSALQPQLGRDIAIITLADHQLERLRSAMLGAVNELKVYPMLEARPPAEGGGRRSTVPGFDQTLRHLFPEVDEEADEALTVAERMVMLKRRLDTATAQASQPASDGQRTRRPWWRFWRR
jgi:hypothetical protein